MLITKETALNSILQANFWCPAVLLEQSYRFTGCQIRQDRTYKNSHIFPGCDTGSNSSSVCLFPQRNAYKIVQSQCNGFDPSRWYKKTEFSNTCLFCSMFIRHSSLSCFLFSFFLIMLRQAKSKKLKIPQSAVSSQTQSSFMSQTRQNNDVFATASVSQHQAPLQRTSPCENTLKIQQTQKNESDTSTPTTPTKRPSSPLIAYVQSLSPVKRSKKGYLLYFNLKLQSASATHPAVCFSRSKRRFLDDRAATKTALKLERYNISEDGQTIFINNMTKQSSPATSEYNFQFTDIQKTGNSTLQSMLQNAVDMDIVDVTAKVVYKDNEPQIVGASKLKKSNCHIADQTTQLKLILWENNIEVNVEEVYSFKQVRLRRDGQTSN